MNRPKAEIQKFVSEMAGMEIREDIYEAFVHPSYSNENRMNVNNQRFEFIGDSVLSLIVSTIFYHEDKNYKEGDLTKLRAKFVSKRALSYFAKELKLGTYLLLGVGEESTGGRYKESNIADCLEAILGKLYFVYGFEFVMKFFKETVYKVLEINRELLEDINDDYKTRLQEVVQAENKSLIYNLLYEKRSRNGIFFKMNVVIDGINLGIGTGRTKKEASNEAAKQAIRKLIV